VKYDAQCGRCPHRKLTHLDDGEGACMNGRRTTFENGRSVTDDTHRCDCPAYQAEGETDINPLCAVCGVADFLPMRSCPGCDRWVHRDDEGWDCWPEHVCPADIKRDEAKLRAWTEAQR
jgi:hypothetical protein